MKTRRIFRTAMGCLAFSIGCATAPVSSQSPETIPAEVERANDDVAPRLVRLLDSRRSARASVSDFQNTALSDLTKLTTPAGYRYKNRYLELGVPLAQALAAAQTDQIRDRLVEAARWTGSSRVRSEALVALAALRNPEDFTYLKEAFRDTEPALQFAAIEAMQIAGQSQSVPLLLGASADAWVPFIRVYAAQAALRMGDSRGRDQLLGFLTDSNWLVRAMAARYLGDLGKAEDAEALIRRLGPEQRNPYVLAELCSAALKLEAKKPGATSGASQAAPGTSRVRSTPVSRRSSAVLELEPLVVTAPRLRLAPSQPIDVRIDNSLVQLLESVAQMPPPEEELLDPAREQLKNLVTPSGFALKLRYSDLSFVVIQGLAGTHNFSLTRRLESLAQDASDQRVRAAALVALSYEPGRKDVLLFQNALRDDSINVRFGAVESFDVMQPTAKGLLADVAQSDRSMALRVYAADVLARSGDSQGKELLLRYMNDYDWVVRSMAVQGLGEVGVMDDYYRIQTRLNSEDNDFVIAESCLAMLKIAARSAS